MRKIDDAPLGPAFEWRLRSALDGVKPLYSRPRYQASVRRHLPAWRLVPAVLAAAAVLTLSAGALASSNPAVLIQRAASAIDSAAHAPNDSMPGEQTTAPATEPERSAPAESGPEKEAPGSQGPSDSPEPRPAESPEPGDASNTGSSEAPLSGSQDPRDD